MLTWTPKELFSPHTFYPFIKSSGAAGIVQSLVLFFRVPEQHSRTLTCSRRHRGRERTREAVLIGQPLPKTSKQKRRHWHWEISVKLRQNPVCGTNHIITRPCARLWFSPGRSTVTRGQVCLSACLSEYLKVCNEEVNQAGVQMSEGQAKQQARRE